MGGRIVQEALKSNRQIQALLPDVPHYNTGACARIGGALNPNKVAISPLTRLRCCASPIGSCTSTHVHGRRIVDPRSLAIVRVDFS